jgi:small subunit ribosomal protein S6
MAEHISKYETIFIVRIDKTEEEQAAVVEKIKSLIEANATVESVDVWGKRRLAYEISDQTEGYYVLVNFAAQPEFPKELERVYGITEDIIRSIIIKKEEK